MQPNLKLPLITTSAVIHKRAANTKQKVCTVAARQFNAHGYGNVSIESILQEAEIARSTFYRFFKDKEDLFLNIIVPMFQQAKRALANIDPDQPELIINGIAECYLEIWDSHREGLILSSNIGKSLFQLVQPAHDKFALEIYRLMEKINEIRMLRNDDAHLSAVMLAQTAVKLLPVCEKHAQFNNVFISALRGMLLKW